jgi:hypothetical protein
MSSTNYGRTDCKINVWVKTGTIVSGKNPDIWRKDCQNNILKYTDYGKITKYGWQIDHIIPKNRGGSDDIINLQILSSKTNMSMKDRIIDKPGLANLDYHNAIIYKKYGKIVKVPKPKLVLGSHMNVRAIVTNSYNIAEIIRIDKENNIVSVKWLDSNYMTNIIYDGLLFETLNIKRKPVNPSYYH